MKHILRRSFAVACFAAGIASSPAVAEYVFNKFPAPGANSGFWGLSAKTQKFMLITSETPLSASTSYIYDPSKNPPEDLVPLPLPPNRPAPALPWVDMAGLSINDEGVVVGSVGDAQTNHGLIYKDGVFTIYTRPGWDYTEFRAINNPDPSTGRPAMITGFSMRPFDGVNPASVGFVFDGTTFHEFTVPGALPFATVTAHGINDAGQVVGSAQPYQAGPVRAMSFLRQPDGTMTLFTVPNGYVLNGAPAVHTRARGINNNGVIAGVTRDANGLGQIFVGTSAGFQVLTLPNAAVPEAALGGFTEGINDSGQIAASYLDSNNFNHALIITPAAVPTGTTSDGAYTFTVEVVPNTPIFIDPMLAVGYDYAIGTGDPRIATARFPVGIGDNKYRLIAGKKAYDLNGGVIFDFRTHGFPEGIDKFRLTCIDTSAALDPLSSTAFPTELTFVSAGTFTGTQKPLTFNVAEHALPALMSVNICPRQSRR